MTFGALPLFFPPGSPRMPRPRYFDKVDILTGTPEADTFFVGPPEFATQSWQDDWMIRMRLPKIFDESTDSEVDILVYQEQERANYLEGYQAPTARSYTYIEDFDLIEDEIIVGAKPYMIEIDDEIIAGESSNDFDDFDLFVLENPWRDQNLDVADLIVTDFQISDNDRIIMAGKDLG